MTIEKVWDNLPSPELLIGRNKKPPLTIQMILVTEDAGVQMLFSKLHCFILPRECAPYFFSNIYNKAQVSICKNQNNFRPWNNGPHTLIYFARRAPREFRAAIAANERAFSVELHLEIHRIQLVRTACQNFSDLPISCQYLSMPGVSVNAPALVFVFPFFFLWLQTLRNRKFAHSRCTVQSPISKWQKYGGKSTDRTRNKECAYGEEWFHTWSTGTSDPRRPCSSPILRRRVTAAVVLNAIRVVLPSGQFEVRFRTPPNFPLR